MPIYTRHRRTALQLKTVAFYIPDTDADQFPKDEGTSAVP